MVTTVRTINRESISDSSTDQCTEAIDERTCPECRGSLIADEANAETTCRDCGLVVAEKEIDRGPEWRAYTKREADAKSRVGAPLTQTLHDKGLSTIISIQDKDADGNHLSARKRARMRRLRTWHRRAQTRNASEQNLRTALSEIERMSSALGVPKTIRETSALMYRRALDSDLIRGRSIEAVATATLYAACRMESLPRSLDEVAIVARVQRTAISRAYLSLCRELDLNFQPVDPKQYVPRFCSQLNLSKHVENTAIEIIEDTAREGLQSGKSPIGIAGAAIYTASQLCDVQCTQPEVCDVAGVCTATLRERYHEQLNIIDMNKNGGK